MSICGFLVTFNASFSVAADPTENEDSAVQEEISPDSDNEVSDEEQSPEGEDTEAQESLEEPDTGSEENVEPQGEKVPFNIGLFPYANINAYKTNPHNYFTLDFIVGLNHTVTGVALGAAPVVLKDIKGAQIGAGNLVLGEMTGVQLGVINVGAGKITGAQVGLINYADEASENSGTVGLINVVRKGGRHSLDVWTSDATIINVGTKIGGNRVYAIWAFGLQPKIHPILGDEDSVLWGPGIGIGFNIPIVNGGSISIESMTFALFDDDPKIDSNNYVGTMPQTLTQIRLLGNYQINDLIGIFAGPAINVSMGAKNLDAVSYLPESATFHVMPTAPPGQIGIGFVAGAQIF